MKEILTWTRSYGDLCLRTGCHLADPRCTATSSASHLRLQSFDSVQQSHRQHGFGYRLLQMHITNRIQWITRNILPSSSHPLHKFQSAAPCSGGNTDWKHYICYRTQLQDQLFQSQFSENTRSVIDFVFWLVIYSEIEFKVIKLYMTQEK